jgi:thiol-disulfide isomerase/thioredoxin
MQTSHRRPFLAAAAGLVLALLLTGCSKASAGVPDQGFISGDGTVTQVAAADRKAPVSFAGTTLDGDRWDLRDHRGEVVVVNVWGSWCAPCIAEAPALEAVHEQTKADGVVFVGINTKDNAASARAHERRFSISYPSIDDDGGRVLLALRGSLPPSAIPSTLVLDRRGRVAARVLGRADRTTLRELVADVVDEAP